MEFAGNGTGRNASVDARAMCTMVVQRLQNVRILAVSSRVQECALVAGGHKANNCDADAATWHVCSSVKEASPDLLLLYCDCQRTLAECPLNVRDATRSLSSNNMAMHAP